MQNAADAAAVRNPRAGATLRRARGRGALVRAAVHTVVCTVLARADGQCAAARDQRSFRTLGQRLHDSLRSASA